MKFTNISLKILLTFIEILIISDITFINCISISTNNKIKLSEGLKIKENSMEAIKESTKLNEAIAIEIELEKHRMKMKHKKRVIKFL